MSTSLAELKRKAIFRFVIGVPLIALMLFLPAGTLRYWQAWIFMVVICFPLLFLFAYLIRHDPELLERRFKMTEKEPAQKRLAIVSIPFVLAAFLLPGFDRRFGWSSVPVIIEIAAMICILSAYVLFFFVLKENRFASRIIEVEQEQKVIRTGPYAVIRHPMYLAALVIYLGVPPALGSWWALIPSLIWPIYVVLRILNEEKVLAAKLDGYLKYKNQVKYRLIPGMW